MTKAEEKGIFKASVIVKDELGLPNYMTMFYIEPGTYKEEDVPAIFKIKGKIVPAILISQYHNTLINDIPVSLPYQQPKHSISHERAAALCRKKGKGWHIMTNTEFVYLMHEAEELGHVIGGNTDHGKNAKKPEEKGITYDSAGRTLTGCDPITWSHDGTKDGVFGLNGNLWDIVAGLRLHYGVIEYIKDNDAAAEDYDEKAKEWTAAVVDGKKLKLHGVSSGGVKLSIDEEIEAEWDGCQIYELKIDGLKEMPEIAYKLGIVPHDWLNETAAIWADSILKEAVPFRGSSFYHTSYGGVGGLNLSYGRGSSYNSIGFRSALYLEDWELVTELLKAGATAHA